MSAAADGVRIEAAAAVLDRREKVAVVVDLTWRRQVDVPTLQTY